MRLALIGGAGGIGRALAQAARAQGGDVLILDLATSLERHNIPGPAFEIDAQRPETLENIANDIGSLNGVVNLCGFMAPPQHITDYTPETWDETLGGNLSAAFHISRIFAPRIAPGGAFVHVGSGLGHNARPNYGAYAISKAGIAAMTRQMALELAPHIRVNCVAPSAVDTAFLRGGTGRSDESAPPPFDAEAYAAAIPMGRIAKADDITGPILFLLSDAARYITGQTLHVNGGAYMP